MKRQDRSVPLIVVGVALVWAGGVAAASTSRCGNNTVEGLELCDGTNLNGRTCTNLGFTHGTLACSATCTFDILGCIVNEADATTRFKDNGNGTITDRFTGLMWEKKVASGSGQSTCLDALHGVNSTCTWTQATGAWITAVNAEGGAGFAGYNNWRIPTVWELQSIVLDPCDASPCVYSIFNTESDSLTAKSDYASTSAYPFAGGLSNVWSVDFLDGNVVGSDKSSSFRVRAVRANQ